MSCLERVITYPTCGRFNQLDLDHLVSTADSWKDDFTFINATCIGRGGSGIVFVIDRKKVIKAFPCGDEGCKSLERERHVFDRLQRNGYSKHFVRFYEEWASGLVLERCERTLREELMSFTEGEQPPFAMQWSQDICMGLSFLHQNDIYHGDLGCQNIMLDQDNKAKLCDFAGSRLKEGEVWKDAWISYEVRSQHPKYRGQQPNLETEIFALGSVLFEIWTSRPPFASESNFFVRQNFQAYVFPVSSVKSSQVQTIIHNCWRGVYKDVQQVIQQLESV
jgi:serine/threonine protein kinase